MAITETGYYRPNFEDILEELTVKAQELFGEDIDTSDQTILGKFLNIMAYVRAKDHEMAELIFYSRFPNTATGINLDRLCPFVGLTRNVATAARYEVTVTGEAGTTIPFDFLVSTESGIEFYNTMETTIEEESTECTITVECTQFGVIGNVPASDITEIVNPDAGIDSVVGVKAVKVGEDEESDHELRQRILKAGEGAGACNEPAIRAAILKVPTVTSATVLVNDSDEVDSIGNLPHSIACYVAGGLDYSYEIGDAIFQSKPVGIKTNGSETVIVTDDGGYTHPIKFNRVQNIYITISISISTSVDFEGEAGITEMKKNISEYINGLGVGKDIVFSMLYGHIYAVKGVTKVTDLKISTDGTTFITNDISISELQCAVCSDITVSEV